MSTSTKPASFPPTNPHLLIGRYSGFIRRVVLTELQSFTIQINECYTKKKGGEELESLTALALAAANLSETESTVGIAAAVAANVGRDQFHVLVHGEVSSWRACGTLTLPFSGIIHSDVEGRMHLSISSADINIMTAPFLQRSFIQSLAQCTFNIEWIRSEKDRGLIVMRGETEYEQYQCQREVEKIDFGESESDIASDSAGSGTYTTTNRSHQRSLIQSVSTLALICRYLDTKSLVAVYKTSHQLSDAACNLIAHQSGSEVAIEHTFDVCRSYLVNGGQMCTFTKVKNLHAAFLSRLFHYQKSVRINPFVFYNSKTENSDANLINWLPIFLLSNAPTLRSLAIEFPMMNLKINKHKHDEEEEYHDDANDEGEYDDDGYEIKTQDDTSNDDSNPTLFELESTLSRLHFMSARSFQYLRLLHLTLTLSVSEVFCSHLPLSVELLHLTFVPQWTKVTQSVPNSLVSYLKKYKKQEPITITHQSHLRQLLFDIHPSNYYTQMLDLIMLSELHTLDVLEEIHWNVRLHSHLLAQQSGSIDSTRFRSLNLITSLRMAHFLYDELGNMTHTELLSHFPHLHSLSIDRIEHTYNSDAESVSQRCIKEWPLHLQQSLKRLSVQNIIDGSEFISTIAVAKLSQLIQLEMRSHQSTSLFTSVSMRALFTSISQLTELSLGNMAMIPEDILSFQLLPHLLSLREFNWTRTSSPLFRDEWYTSSDQVPGTVEFSLIFPSLTTLQVLHHDKIKDIPYELLRQLSPRLRQFQWLSEAWIDSSALIEARWRQEELRLAPIYERKRMSELTKIVRLLIDKVWLSTRSASFQLPFSSSSSSF